MSAITPWAIPPHLSPQALAALREQRRIAAEEYEGATGPWWFGVALVGGILGAVAIGSGIAMFFMAGAALAAGVVAVILLAGLASTAMLTAGSKPFQEGPHGHASLGRAAPAWLHEVARATGGTPHVTRDLGATLAFLDVHGIALVPRDALTRLHMSRPERHRVEGAVAGRPVAVEIVTGRPLTRPDPGSPHEGVGSHLFVFVAGASGATHVGPVSHGGFDLVAGYGGVTLSCSLRDGLPRPEVVLDAIAHLGPWRPWSALPPSADVPAPPRATPREAIESFVTAVLERDFERAVLVAGPDLAFARRVELSSAMLASLMVGVFDGVSAFRVGDVHEDPSAAEADVHLQLVDGRVRGARFQLEKHFGAWRLSWVDGVGRHVADPTNRMG